MQIIVKNIPIQVIRKKIKNINLTIKHNPNMVILSMPYFTDIEAGLNFANKKLPWIKKNLKQNEFYTLPDSFENGSNLFIYGKKYPILRKENKNLSVRFDKEYIYLSYPDNTDYEKLSNLINKFYKKLVILEINSRLNNWEKLLNLYSSSFYVKTMKTKWGSCNIKTKRLCFNSNLAKYPLKCLDYLIIHELAHLRYPNHNKEFYDFVTNFCPDYKEIRKILKT